MKKRETHTDMCGLSATLIKGQGCTRWHSNTSKGRTQRKIDASSKSSMMSERISEGTATIAPFHCHQEILRNPYVGRTNVNLLFHSVRLLSSIHVISTEGCFRPSQ